MKRKTRSNTLGLDLLIGLFSGLSGLIGCLAVILQLAFYLALVGGIIYFIVFACTHWLRWQNMREVKYRGKVNGHWWYCTPDSNSWPQFWVLVDRETIGQSIGVKDKHGDDIYEFDIIAAGLGAVWDDVIFCVLYDEHQLKYRASNLNDKKEWMINIAEFRGGLEIRGNIYDTPQPRAVIFKEEHIYKKE